jgi:hypothetical protein
MMHRGMRGMKGTGIDLRYYLPGNSNLSSEGMSVLDHEVPRLNILYHLDAKVVYLCAVVIMIASQTGLWG